MGTLRLGAIIGGLVVVAGALLIGQQQRPGTLDDLLGEIRGLRADLAEASTASLRAQLVTARLVLQEARLSALAQQLASVRQQLSDNQQTLAPFAEQVQQAQGTNSQLLAPLRNMIEQVERRDRELRAQEAELARVIGSEETRWSDFNARLDEIERSIGQPRR